MKPRTTDKTTTQVHDHGTHFQQLTIDFEDCVHTAGIENRHYNGQFHFPTQEQTMAGDSRLTSPCVSLLLLLLFSFVQSQEQQVLLKLKSHWGSPPSLRTWNSTTSSESHCGWRGVTCVDNAVTNITLRNDASIAGDVPSFICNLTSLSVLDLYNDSIKTSFPDLSGCRNLTHLNLGQNYLQGTIPIDIGTSLSKLVYLNVVANSLHGDFPESISRASALRELFLDANQFNGSFPLAELGSISTMEVLTLAYNPFAPWRLPPEIGNLKKLTNLSISNANLTGEIPETFKEVVALQHLDLSNNRLTGRIPAGIWGLKNITTILLFQNDLYGEIPATIGATKLASIDVSRNQLNGSIPEDFRKLQNLQYLFLYQNNFAGEIPVGIAKITTLRDIRLFTNQLIGSLPPELGKHSHLYNLEVGDNKLTGELPRNLCESGILNSLTVFNNNLTGTVPVSLGNCSSLVNIQLFNNSFSGEFPPQIWSLIDLSVVVISDNHLTGKLPDVLPWNLTRLNIGNNRFSGNIPSEAGNLKVFKGSGNDFSGELPSDMKGISNLQQLLLDRNRLSGAIPTSIEKLESLTDLNLSSNYLTGDIPPSIGSLPVLTYLDLSNNSLSGEIPSSMGLLKLNELDLSSNSLTGTVPSKFENAAYNESFLSNPGLCSSSDQSAINLPSCSSRSRKLELSNGLLALFISLGTVLFLAVILFVFFAVRDIWRRNTVDDHGNWKLTSFSLLNFTEGNIIGHLTSENLIGSGASGEVYKVSLDGPEGKVVAVKMTSEKRTLDARLEKEFHTEVEILGSIRHLNIIKLLCCISSPESKLLVYDYMKNGSLDQWMQKKRVIHESISHQEGGNRGLDWNTRMSIAVGAARGLSYMHHECKPPIVHGDVKSSNILLDADFTAKVADFGLARILVSSSEPEVVSSFSGSFGYMAPECAYTSTMNDKMDVYSFGVVLLELTTGKQARDGDANGGLVEWTWRQHQDRGSVVDIVDDDIRDSRWLEEIGMVMRLGLICTGALPSARPTMRDVLQMLLKFSRERHAGAAVRDRDFVVEVPVSRKGSRSRRSRSVKVSSDDRDADGDDTSGLSSLI